MKKIFLCVIFLSGTFALYAQTTDDTIELLKSDMKTNRKAIITETMKFTEPESKVFWPIYNEFEVELEKLADRRIANIKDFAANYDSLTDKKADELIKNAFSFQEDRLSLNKKYYKKFSEALTPTVAAKYMQVEHQIQLLLDISVEGNLPLVKKPGTGQK